MIIGGIIKVVFVMWIVGVVISLYIGLFFSIAGFLGFCDVYISSAGDALTEEENVLFLCVISLSGVLIFSRGCSGALWVFFFSVGSVGRVKFGARDEAGGCGYGFLFLVSLCLCLYFLPWPSVGSFW